MSQKTHIISVKISGAPIFLGNISGTESYTRNPHKVMEWLCDGWRTRFNQIRSTRSKYSEDGVTLIPIGDNVTDITHSEARSRYSFLSALPSMVLNSTEKKESQDWFSAAKRKKTYGGSMPRFRSKKNNDQIFFAWHNKGANARYSKTGRRTGVVTITGKNPAGKKTGRWKITIRVKTTQEIRDYTSILVNWTRKTLTFTNPTEAVSKSKDTDSVIGIDRGGVVSAALSNGDLKSVDQELISKMEKKKRYHQKKMSKARSRALKNGGKNHMVKVMHGSKYQHHKKKAAHYSYRQASYRKSWLQEITTNIIRNHGVIVLEDLNIKNMTSKGGAGKRGMNRVFLNSSPALLSQFLGYKALSTGRRIVYLPPHYTSQRCHSCGYASKENRESQSVFLCKKCSHTTNADTNAAKNLVSLYNRIIEGTDLPAYSCNDYKNGSGEIIRPKIPKELKEEFFLHGSLNDAIDPSSCTLV